MGEENRLMTRGAHVLHGARRQALEQGLCAGRPEHDPPILPQRVTLPGPRCAALRELDVAR